MLGGVSFIYKSKVLPVIYVSRQTRIFVTHGLGYLRLMDEIVVLKNGEVVGKGSFSRLIHKGDFRQFLLHYFTAAGTEEEEEPGGIELERLDRRIFSNLTHIHTLVQHNTQCGVQNVVNEVTQCLIKRKKKRNEILSPSSV